VGIVFRTSAEDLLHCRFAISPLGETADALRSLARPAAAPGHLPWQRQARTQLPGLQIGPLLAMLSARGYQPDFLNPPPDSPFTEISAELDQVRAIPPQRVAAELAQWQARNPAAPTVLRDYPELSGEPARARDLLASMLHRAWQGLIEPWWPRLRDILDADLTVRARQLAQAGLAVTLNDLHPKITYRNGTLSFAITSREELDATGAELVLIPSVFAWPGAGVTFNPPAIIYPARGIASLWQPPARTPSDLAHLIGATRAMLLSALAEPASTSGLAARCSLPLSTTSEHLTIMRANGLISTTRTGRYLHHQRTPLGIALSPSAPPHQSLWPSIEDLSGPATDLPGIDRIQ
jgi:DNA-binding transcriptional ArsR family regulator